MAWQISVRKGEKRKDIIIPSENGDELQGYKKAKKTYQILKEKYPTYIIDIISRTMAFPPKKPITRGSYYCPYCRKDRKFVIKNSTGYKHCTICGISDQDFYVKKYNGLWR